MTEWQLLTGSVFKAVTVRLCGQKALELMSLVPKRCNDMMNLGRLQGYEVRGGSRGAGWGSELAQRTRLAHLVAGKTDVSGKAAPAGDLLRVGAGRRRPVSE